MLQTCFLLLLLLLLVALILILAVGNRSGRGELPLLEGGKEEEEEKGEERKRRLRLPVREPWLFEIQAGRKTIEGRAGPAEKFKDWVGEEVLMFNSRRSIPVKILKVKHYATISEYLDSEDLLKIAPHIAGDKKLSKKEVKEKVLEAYHEFYTDEVVAERGGMNALHLELSQN